MKGRPAVPKSGSAKKPDTSDLPVLKPLSEGVDALLVAVGPLLHGALFRDEPRLRATRTGMLSLTNGEGMSERR